jgi:hypothetical protein
VKCREPSRSDAPRRDLVKAFDKFEEAGNLTTALQASSVSVETRSGQKSALRKDPAPIRCGSLFTMPRSGSYGERAVMLQADAMEKSATIRERLIKIGAVAIEHLARIQIAADHAQKGRRSVPSRSAS